MVRKDAEINQKIVLKLEKQARKHFQCIKKLAGMLTSYCMMA